MFSKKEHLFIIFLIIWFILGVIQSVFTDYSGEEAYYYLFSQRLDWGYLDHPPVVAITSYLGTLLFDGNLGGRLFIVVLNTFSLWFLYKSIDEDKRNTKTIIYICISLIGIHVGSYFIKTDVPLIFFEALFLLYYKRYLKEDNFKNILVLSIAGAGMFLSKYHGVLILFFILLSNLTLLKKRSFWFVVIGVLVLITPHLLWQYNHDWASFRFHLSDREDLGFQWKNVINYTLSQPIVLGALLGFLLLPISIIYKTKNKFEKALKFILVGVLVFFFVNSFRVYVHKHWTSIAMLPMIILSVHYLSDKTKLNAIVKYVGVFSVVLLGLFRLYLMVDFVPDTIDGKAETLHNWKEWGKELDSLSKGKNVVFYKSYENASRFTFLTGRNAHCLSPYDFNNTHYDFWDIEDTLQGKSVLFVKKRGKLKEGYKKHITKIGEPISYQEVDDYQSFSKVWVELDDNFQFTPGLNSVTIKVTNKHSYPITSENKELLPRLFYFIRKSRRTLIANAAIESLVLQPGETKDFLVKLEIPKEISNCQLRFGVKAGFLPATINSKWYNLKVIK